MKKTNKKLVAIAVLLLLVGVSIGTYAIYRNTYSGTGTVSTAAWEVAVKKGNTALSNEFTFTGNDITWTKNTSAVDGKIAPGSTGKITFTIDADGSEVPVDYSIALGAITNAPTGLTVTGATTGTIAYSATSGAMEKTVTLTVAWAGADSDDTAKDTNDLSFKGSSISIPVTVTVKQHLGD